MLLLLLSHISDVDQCMSTQICVLVALALVAAVHGMGYGRQRQSRYGQRQQSGTGGRQQSGYGRQNQQQSGYGRQQQSGYGKQQSKKGTI